MKIQYRHVSDPETIKIYDTKTSLELNRFINKSQAEWDKEELEKMARRKKEGLVIEYKVIEP